jgi:hypothetical protein
MKKYFAFFFLPIFICCCSSPVSENHTSVQPIDTIVNPAKGLFTINEPEILFLWPDSLSMEKMKSEDSDAFYTGADDYSFYTSQTMDLADSLDIKTETTNKPMLDFVASNNKHYLVNRPASGDKEWGAYLFNGKDAPKFEVSIDMGKDSLLNFFKSK